MGQHFNNFWTHAKDQPYLDVRYIDTDNAPGAVEEVFVLQFPVCPFVNKCVP